HVSKSTRRTAIATMKNYPSVQCQSGVVGMAGPLENARAKIGEPEIMSTVRRPVKGDSSTESVTTKAHHTILGQTIQGGFLDGVKLEFVDGLNCIIGGRGTGKTTLLEFMRYVLGLMPDQRLNAAHARAVGNQVQSNLGSGGVRVDVKTKHGVRYAAERS